jgi:hypothetical protein
MGIFTRLFKGEGEPTDSGEEATGGAGEPEPPTVKKPAPPAPSAKQKAAVRATRSPSKRPKPNIPAEKPEPAAGAASSGGRPRRRSKPPSKRPRKSSKPPKAPKVPKAPMAPASLPPLVLESDFPLPPTDPLPTPEPVDELWDLDSELEERFSASFMNSEPPGTERSPPVTDEFTTEQDLAQVRDLFNDMAVHHMAQVRDLMLELGRVEVATSWVSLCEPTVESMRRMCEKLELPELSLALEEFAGALGAAKSSSSGTVRGALRERLLAAYAKMMEILPRAFELGSGRETMLVQLLLLQVPGVHKLAVDKLYAAGLHQFDMFLTAKPDELAAVSGIELSLAERIGEHFRDYRRSFRSVLAEPVPAEERRRLAELVERLRDEHSAFERASAGWSAEARADKKRLRRARGETLSAIYVSLARLGEVDRVDALQKSPTDRQLAELEAYLRQPATQI